MDKRPIIGITMGDPAGVGPEVIVKALSNTDIYDEVNPVVLGDPEVMREACARFAKDRQIIQLESEEEGIVSEPGKILLIPVSKLDFKKVQPGRPDLACGKAALKYIEEAVRLALSGFIYGIVTAPVNKDSLMEAGSPFQGHTELLAAITGTKEYAMMLAGDRLKVVLVTTHHPLKEVPGLLTQELVAGKIMLVDRTLTPIVGAKPRIAVAGLNPHAGEAGRFGREEIEIIGPAVQECRQKGADVWGPFPPDAVFREAAEGSYDVVVCMYHDQGLIPLKLLHFWDGVNITLGLPFIRCSVDHGTAYEIAWQGKARPDSMLSALKWAGRLLAEKK
jgi:4-hydroxythreonine-4-phosphate dehydrogenase